MGDIKALLAASDDQLTLGPPSREDR